MGKKIKIGQPIKYTQAERIRILKELEEYVEKEEYPAVSKFCTAQGLAKQRLFEWAKDEKLNSEGKNNYPLGEYFSELIQRIHDKQEAFIEEHTMNGNIPPSFAIFKLKQPCIGWTDKTDVGLMGGMKISIGLPPEFKNGD